MYFAGRGVWLRRERFLTGAIAMSVTLLMHDGKPAVELPDSKGDVFVYTIAAGERSYTLAKAGTGTTYKVSRPAGSHWRCTCPAFKFNPRRLSNGCKHSRAAEALAEILEGLLTGLHSGEPIC